MRILNNIRYVKLLHAHMHIKELFLLTTQNNGNKIYDQKDCDIKSSEDDNKSLNKLKCEIHI